MTGKLNAKFAGSDQTIEGIAADGSGWVVVGGAQGKDVLFARVSEAGAVVTEVALDLGGIEEGYGVAKSGNLYAVWGYRSTPKPTVGFLVLVDKDGKCAKNCTTGFYTGGGGGTDNSVNGAVEVGDSTWLLAGQSLSVDNGTDGVLWRVDAEAKVLWESTLPGLKQLKVVRDLQPAPFGWVAAGEIAGAQMLVGTDPVGNLLWHRTFLGLPHYLLKLPDPAKQSGIGGFAVVGELQGDSRVVFTDPWGYQSCLEANACFGVTACDDKAPCTDDFCTAKSGCVHLPATDGQPCGAGQACASGNCVTALP